jgi:hypothetical protein
MQGVVSRMTSQVTTTHETLLNGKSIVVLVQAIVNVEFVFLDLRNTKGMCGTLNVLG